MTIATKKTTPRLEKYQNLSVKAVAIVFAFLLVFVGFIPKASAAKSAYWANPTDAIEQLWGTRLTNQKPWPINMTNDYEHLDDRVKAVSVNTLSGLVIPEVSINSLFVTDGLKQMAWALLTYDLANPAANHFVPIGIGTPPAETLNLNEAFWVNLLRTPHGNTLNHLPQLVLPALNLDQCPNLAGLDGRDRVVDTLNQQAGISNQLRWHCYAKRFDMVGDVEIPLTGYVEITQYEFTGAGFGYAYAASEGRIIFDYINGRVFYSPAHYKQWKKADFSPDPTPSYGCTPARTCANPFFELVQ